MNIKTIEKSLRDYKRKKAIIETTLLRIANYKEAINNPELHEGLFLKQSIEPGMPRTQNYKSVSPVEESIMSEEKSTEILKGWIKEDQSRIYPYQIEKEQIDLALASLNKQQRFIITCKYFEDMFWRDIEINYNNEFRQQNYITVSGIRKINQQALDRIGKLLKPYYGRCKTSKIKK